MNTAMAICHMILLNGNVDSSFKQIPAGYGYDSHVQVIKHIIADQCPGRSVEIHSNTCKEIIRGVDYSRACIVETSVGYFFVTRDMLDNINLVFNRWD